jgi:two-component system, OmpR family, alkaline phosphatase synthesis response regulator PhoP
MVKRTPQRIILNTMPKILVVDDKANVRMVLFNYLSKHSFSVIMADNGLSALNIARAESPDLILLDVMMPEMDGHAFLATYRRECNVPVIIITARHEESDAVIGLELGADDFVCKPFRMRELVARIHAVLRRHVVSQTREQVSVGDLIVNYASHIVTVRGQIVDITPTEFKLLGMLVGAPGRAFTREQLSERLFESGFEGLDRTINVHIRNLRTKIELDPGQPKYIETVFGVGYRLKAP